MDVEILTAFRDLRKQTSKGAYNDIPRLQKGVQV